MINLTSFYRTIYCACRNASKSNNFNQITTRNFAVKINEQLTVKLKEKEDEREKLMKEIKENYIPIYRFPKVKTVAAINNLKTYQAIITALSVPVTFVTYPEYILPVSYTGFSFIIALSFVSYILKNSIGAIYVNRNDSDIIRIAVIDFWGRRQDKQFNIDEIIPFEDQMEKGLSDKLFFKVKFNSNNENFKFLSKDSEILDIERFTRVFGDY